MIATRTESGHRERGVAGWLGLAATPAFAAMALLTYVSDGNAAMLLCTAGHGIAPLNGMTSMYVLMSVFHSQPWLKRIVRRRESVDGKARP